MARSLAEGAPLLRRLKRIILWAAATLAILGVVAAVALLRALAFDAPEEFLHRKGQLSAVESLPLAGDSLHDAYQLTLHSDAGYSVSGHLRVPLSASQAPAPGLIVIGGVRTGRLGAELVTPEQPYVILGLDYPWDGPTSLTAWQFIVRLLDIRRAMLLTPSAVMLALDYLESRPDVEASEIVLVGSSFGAQLIVVAAALDPRGSPVMVIYGGGDYAELLRENLKLEPGWLRNALAAGGARLLAPLEPLDYVADIAPRPVVMINGIDDKKIPRRSVESLYEAARQPKRLIWLPEGHISSRNPALLERVMLAAVEALAELEADSAVITPVAGSESSR